MGVVLLSSLLAASPSHAQGTAIGVAQINVAAFGAIDDAQDSQEFGFTTFGSGATAIMVQGTTCNLVTGATNVLTCTNAIFNPPDYNKMIQIPQSSGSTVVDTICSVGTGPFPTTTVDVCGSAANVSGAYVTWGTDNAAAFTAAAAACPQNASVTSILPFTSRGCVIIIPVSRNGTGSYMFNSGVTMSTETSLQIIGTGNSSRQEQSTQAGVRLITSANIVILTIGNDGGGVPTFASNDYGAFQLSNITFRDTSGAPSFPLASTTGGATTAPVAPGSGAAIGGLRMINVSEALISECSFENFNGTHMSPIPSAPNILSYGIFSDPNVNYSSTSHSTASGFNNNIILFHLKGRNNSVFYDSSLAGQDGPIVIGGDIFPENTVSSGEEPNNVFTNVSGFCYGFINAGPIRMYGTHIDARLDNFSGAGGQKSCAAVLMAGGGLINTKIESSKTISNVPSKGVGTYLLGGNSLPNPISSIVGSGVGTSAYVTVTFMTTPSPPFYVGEVVQVSGTFSGVLGTPNYDGQFTVAYVAPGTGSISYLQANVSTSSVGTGTVTGMPTIKAGLNLLLTNTGQNHGVFIGMGSTSNDVNIVSSGTAGSAFMDVNGPGGGNLIAAADAGSGTTVNWTGGTAQGSVSAGVGEPGGFVNLAASIGAMTAGVGAIGGAGGNAALSAAAGGAATGGTAAGGSGGTASLSAAAGGAGNGTTATGGLGGNASVTAGTGGATTGTGAISGTGGMLSLSAGTGGASVAGSTAGNGGSLALSGGSGGAAPTGGTNGNGANVTIASGAGGTGTGAAGTTGTIALTVGGPTVGVEISSTGVLAKLGTGSVNADQYKSGAASGIGACSSPNFVQVLNDGSAPTWAQPNLSGLAAGAAPAGTFDFTSATLLVPNSAGAAPTTAASVAYDTTKNDMVFGNGTSTFAIPQMLCRKTTDTTNTGNSTLNIITTCTVPANSMGANGTLKVSAQFLNESGGAGNCKLVVAFSTTSGGAGTAFLTGPGAPTGLKGGSAEGILSNRNATNSQVANGYVLYATNTADISSPVTMSLPTTADTFVSFQMQNSVMTDTCALNQYEVILWP